MANRNQLALYTQFIASYIGKEIRIENVDMGNRLSVLVSADDGKTLSDSLAVTKKLFSKYFEKGYELVVEYIGGDDHYKYHQCEIRISKMGTTNI